MTCETMKCVAWKPNPKPKPNPNPDRNPDLRDDEVRGVELRGELAQRDVVLHRAVAVEDAGALEGHDRAVVTLGEQHA